MSPVHTLIRRLRMASRICRAERRRATQIDWEAYINRSHLDDSPQMSPLTAAEVFSQYAGRAGYEKHRDCSRCERDEAAPKTSTSYRPPGTHTRWSCAGCSVSFLANLGPDLAEVQDRLLTEWGDTREALRDHFAKKRYQTTLKDLKAWKSRRVRLQESVSEAAQACRMAGLEPGPARWKERADAVTSPLSELY